MDPVTIALGLAQIAPSLLRFFGVGEKPAAVVQEVVDIAKTITGQGDGEAALRALHDDPAKAHEFRMAVLANDAELESIFLADRKDARGRDLALHQAGYTNLRADLMILGDVVGLLACLAAMVYTTWLGVQGVDGGDVSPIIMALNGPLGMLTQQFANGLRDAHQFEFGSSRGSKEKDQFKFSAFPLSSREKDVILGGKQL